MSTQRNVVLLVGSMKKKNSASNFIGNYLLRLLQKKGFKTSIISVDSLLRDKGVALLDNISNSEVIVFSAPLYLDGPPYLLTKAMELIVEHRKNVSKGKPKKFLVITNGGYPESHHNNTVVSIYRQFALKSGFEWLGGLSLGMGAVFSVFIMRKGVFMLPMFSNFNSALEVTAKSVFKGEKISQATIKLIAKPFMPIWLYSFMARTAAKFFAVTNRAENLYYKPY